MINLHCCWFSCVCRRGWRMTGNYFNSWILFCQVLFFKRKVWEQWTASLFMHEAGVVNRDPSTSSCCDGKHKNNGKSPENISFFNFLSAEKKKLLWRFVLRFSFFSISRVWCLAVRKQRQDKINEHEITWVYKLVRKSTRPWKKPEALTIASSSTMKKKLRGRYSEMRLSSLAVKDSQNPRGTKFIYKLWQVLWKFELEFEVEEGASHFNFQWIPAWDFLENHPKGASRKYEQLGSTPKTVRIFYQNPKLSQEIPRILIS